MALKYNAVLFDFDGTVMNSEPGIISAAIHTLGKMKLPIPDNKTMEGMVGPPIRVCLRDVLGIPEGRLEEGAHIYRTEYNKTGVYDAEVFPGMEQLLQELGTRGVKCAIASIKNERVVREAAAHFDIAKYFAAICGSDGGPGVKDKVPIILDAVDRMGVQKDDCILVGDSAYDAQGAQDAGVDFCAALWGFGFRELDDLRQYACRYVAHDIPTLRKFLLTE